MQELALEAVQCVAQDLGNGHKEIDIKNYAKVGLVYTFAMLGCFAG